MLGSRNTTVVDGFALVGRETVAPVEAPHANKTFRGNDVRGVVECKECMKPRSLFYLDSSNRMKPSSYILGIEPTNEDTKACRREYVTQQLVTPLQRSPAAPPPSATPPTRSNLALWCLGSSLDVIEPRSGGRWGSRVCFARRRMALDPLDTKEGSRLPRYRIRSRLWDFPCTIPPSALSARTASHYCGPLSHYVMIDSSYHAGCHYTS